MSRANGTAHISFHVPSLAPSTASAIFDSLGETLSGPGPNGRSAAQRVREITGSASVLLTPSCSASLEMSARLLDLMPGDEVIVPAFSFVTTASSFVWNGARPVFADVDPRSLCLTVASVDQCLSPQTRAVCVVNYGGFSGEIDSLRAYCDEKGIVLIEDNAHGLGGSCGDAPLGAFGHLGTLSFHATKNITCGEGGALLVNSPAFASEAAILQEKGTDRARFLRGDIDRYTWQSVGASWVMADVLAAMLVPQLAQLEEINTKRRSIWANYFQCLTPWAAREGLLLPNTRADSRHTGHLFFIRFRDAQQSERFTEWMRRDGIDVRGHYQALNISPMGFRIGGEKGTCPVSEAAALDLVRLPLHCELSRQQVERVVARAWDFPG